MKNEYQSITIGVYLFPGLQAYPFPDYSKSLYYENWKFYQEHLSDVRVSGNHDDCRCFLQKEG